MNKKRLLSALGVKIIGALVGGIFVIGGIWHFEIANTSTGTMNSATMGAGAWDIVKEALMIAHHLKTDSRGWLNQYDSQNDTAPEFQPVIAYWQQHGVSPTDVECAQYVNTVFTLAKHPLPAIGNALDYWTNYQNGAQPGWQEIPAGKGLPLPGDIIVWGGGQVEGGYTQGIGHNAIVVAVKAPANGTAGSVTVAQANGPGNMISPNPPDQDAPWIPAGINLYRMAITLDTGSQTYQVQTWNVPDTATTKPMSVLGYIRNPSLDTSTGNSNAQLPANLPNSPWVQVAEDAAKQYQIDPMYFVRQINRESGFNPDAVGPAVTVQAADGTSYQTHAIGIAQFLPSTAAGLGIDPRNPRQALPAAAKMVSADYQNYLKADPAALQQSPTEASKEAYMKAFAAYNAGSGNIENALRLYQNQWFEHLPDLGLVETYNYVKYIMNL